MSFDFKLPDNAILHIYASHICEESLGVNDLKFTGRDCASIKKSVENYINSKLSDVNGINGSSSNNIPSIETVTSVCHEILRSIESLTVDIVYVSNGNINISNVGKVCTLPIHISNAVVPQCRYVDLILDYIYYSIDLDKLYSLVDIVDLHRVDVCSYALYAGKDFSSQHGSGSLLLVTPSLGYIRDSVREAFTDMYVNNKSSENAYNCLISNCYRAFYKISKTRDKDFTFECIVPKSAILFDVAKRGLSLEMCVDLYTKCLIG